MKTEIIKAKMGESLFDYANRSTDIICTPATISNTCDFYKCSFKNIDFVIVRYGTRYEIYNHILSYIINALSITHDSFVNSEECDIMIGIIDNDDMSIKDRCTKLISLSEHIPFNSDGDIDMLYSMMWIKEFVEYYKEFKKEDIDHVAALLDLCKFEFTCAIRKKPSIVEEYRNIVLMIQDTIKYYTNPYKYTISIMDK